MSILKTPLLSKLSNLLNSYFKKISKSNNVIVEKEILPETHLQKFLIDIIDNLDKTKLCPFCNKKLIYVNGFGYWSDKHVTFYRYADKFNNDKRLYFRLNDKEIEIFPFDANYNELIFSDWYDHYVAPDKVITIPKDMIFNNIQELDHYLNKIVIFSK